jgi:hypothetical protein
MVLSGADLRLGRSRFRSQTAYGGSAKTVVAQGDEARVDPDNSGCLGTSGDGPQ